MSFTLAGIEFANHHYDERGDVLYLSVADYVDGPPLHPYATPEGHGIEYDGDGRVIAMTLVNIKWLIERDGDLKITWPEVVGHVPSDRVTPVLASAA
jgi:uncharacterized protein YuzE